jgi:hypothetical protein
VDIGQVAECVTMRLLLLAPAALLTSCDHISQRVWNCSSQAQEVTKVLETGERVEDSIPPRSYIASMEGGVQIRALEVSVNGKRTQIWSENQARPSIKSEVISVCRGRTEGLVGEQF